MIKLASLILVILLINESFTLNADSDPFGPEYLSSIFDGIIFKSKLICFIK